MAMLKCAFLVQKLNISAFAINEPEVFSRHSLLLTTGSRKCRSRFSLNVSANQRDPPPLFILDEDIPKKKSKIPEETTSQPVTGYLSLRTPPSHKSGYVAIIGRPNAGKSTLMNQMVGQKLSIVTDKPQTTRHRILGLCSGANFQMVLFDTPGVMSTRQHKLDEVMMKNVRSASASADCILLLVDMSAEVEAVASMLAEAEAAAAHSRSLLVVLNKRDKLRPGEREKKIQWFKAETGCEDVLSVSAKFGHGCQEVKQWLISRLPSGPAYYPKDVVSEHPERFFVAEIVREKIFMLYRQEIPYVCQVNVVRFIEQELPRKHLIEVEVLVERDSQKGILLGKGGSALKAMASAARKDIEDFVGRPVFLEVRVAVKEKWRDQQGLLEEFGIDASSMA